MVVIFFAVKKCSLKAVYYFTIFVNFLLNILIKTAFNLLYISENIQPKNNLFCEDLHYYFKLALDNQTFYYFYIKPNK